MCRKDGKDPQPGCPGFFPPNCNPLIKGCPGYTDPNCPPTAKGCPGYVPPKRKPAPIWFWPVAGAVAGLVLFFIIAIILGATLKVSRRK